MGSLGRLGACCAVGMVLGCAPALNWREIRFAAAPLRMVLPCKPDQAERSVDMGGRTLDLQMQGCQADGATFAVSHVLVADAAQAPQLLEGWRQAVLAHLAASAVQQSPWSPPGAWSMPQALRIQAQSTRPGEPTAFVQAAWFARVDASGLHVFHAVMLSPTDRQDVADTFFSGMALP